MILYLSFIPLLIGAVRAFNLSNDNYREDSAAVAIFQPALEGHSNTFICSGVAIDNHTVLTIAECVNGLSPSDLLVRIGSNHRLNTTVSKVIIHPHFSPDALSNDIAVLKLSERINTVIPTSIYPGPPLSWSNNTTVACVAFSSSASSPKWSHNSAMPQTVCADALRDCFNLTTQHFCGLPKAQAVSVTGATYGSAGGAVYLAQQLIGLISGNPVCMPQRALFAVWLGEFKDWIETQMG